MEATSDHLTKFFDHMSGHEGPVSNSARRARVLTASVLTSLALSALWGVAVGSADAALALGNALKVPAVVLCSALSAAPAALLWSRFSGGAIGTPRLVDAGAQALFVATCWLGALSPLIAVYVHTSSWAGPMLAAGSLGVAWALGARTLLRGLLRDADIATRARVCITAAVFMVLLLAMMIQLASVFAPIFPEGTLLSNGIDGLWVR